MFTTTRFSAGMASRHFIGVLVLLSSLTVFAEDEMSLDEPTPAAPAAKTNTAPAAKPAAQPAAATKTTATTSTTAPAAKPTANPTLTTKSGTQVTSAKNKDYTKPAYFETEEKTVIPPPEFEYDLSAAGNNVLKMGPYELSEKSFFFIVRPLGQFHSLLPKVLDKDEAKQQALVIRWPTEFIQNGQLEMISRDGKVIWKSDIGAKESAQWTKKLDGWKKDLKEKGAKDAQLGGFFGTQYGFLDLSEVPLANQKQTFRFCLSYKEGKTQSRLCSQKYGIKREKGKISLARVVGTQAARVLVQNENAPLNGVVKVSAEMPFTFYAELAGGESYEFIAQPPKLSLMDFAESIKTDMVRVVGFDVKPFGNYTILDKKQDGKLTMLIGFESTIDDPREFWAIEIPKTNPILYFPGTGGGVFKQKFELNDLPQARARVYFKEDTPQGTYIDGKILKARKLPQVKVTSDQLSVKMEPKRNDLFDWKFGARNSAEFNRSFMNVEYEGKVYKSYFELYRAYANEFSLRFSAIVSTAGTVPVGELAYNHWFENIFGWENHIFASQRWGVSAKYFKSLSQLNINDGATKVDLTVTTFDLKYRLTPGLWTRDESHGIMLSYQDVAFGELKAPLVGAGWFWARSMPRVFDDFFNLFPFMRYPKWVDMEFIYYGATMKAGIKPNNNLALNFHGQVLWKKNIFGEAGFGMKRYAFQDDNTSQRAELNTFYGTVGLGMKF